MNYSLPPLPNGVRCLSDEQSAWVNTNDPDSRGRVHDHCITCNGKRGFDWYTPGSRTEVGHYDCTCEDQYILYRRFLFSGIGLPYQKLAWSDFFYLQQEPKDAAKEYLGYLDGYLSSGMGMILTGDSGSGKTMFANLMLKEIIAGGFGGHYTTMAAMINSFADGWTSTEAKQWFNRQIRGVNVLVIDDLGRERKQDNKTLDSEARSLAVGTIEEVLRHRVQQGKATIVTTNLDTDQIKAGYGGHSFNLLRECSIVVNFRGEERDRVSLRAATENQQRLVRPIVVG